MRSFAGKACTVSETGIITSVDGLFTQGGSVGCMYVLAYLIILT